MEGLERFRREAKILAKCEHSNIVSFDDIFEAYNTAYIVMEFVDGQELSERLKDKGKLQEAELKDILCPLLDALEVVHQKEFVHRISSRAISSCARMIRRYCWILVRRNR